MAIVSGAPESEPLLEVTVLHGRDAAAATAGEADRLLLVSEPERGGLSPEPSVLSAALRETDLPVRVMLRVEEGLSIDGGQFSRLVGTARTCLELGAAGVSFGFLDYDLEIDRANCSALAAELVGVGWTFHRGFDQALEPRRAWRDVLDLPGVDAVASAGSTRGLAAGGDELVARAGGNPRIAALLLVSGGLSTEQVPWLIRAGVRQFGLGDEVRPGGSWTKAYVDAAAVRAWRLLLDDAHQRALGVPVD
ncbi:MAG: copper homeostasis protein CutC [Marmoricola sp.]